MELNMKYEKNDKGYWNFNFYENDKIIYSAIPMVIHSDLKFLREKNVEKTLTDSVAVQLELMRNLFSYSQNMDESVKTSVFRTMSKLTVEDFKNIINDKLCFSENN